MRRFIVVVVTATLLMLGVLLMPGQVSGSPQPSVGGSVARHEVQTVAALPSLKPKVKWHWWGVELYFNKTQTKMIAAGYGAVAGYFTPAKLLGAFVAMEVVQSYAADAVDQGACLKITRVGPGGVPTYPSIYSC